jgi:CHAT domain-containing protein
VLLVRGERRDAASVEIDARNPGILVAIVDEAGADVSLRIRATGEAVPAPGSEVESNFEGEGFEIATLEIARPGTVTVALDGPRAWIDARRVRMRVLIFPLASTSDPAAHARLAGFREWSLGTRIGVTGDEVSRDLMPHVDGSIAAFMKGGKGDARFAGLARLLRARTLYFHEIDWRTSRDEAARAAHELADPEVDDKLNAARARRLEAAALQEISFDKTAKIPSAVEADSESRRILHELTRSATALDEVGVARAFNWLGLADLYTHQWSAARENLEEAVRHYQRAGFRAGLLQSRRNLALLATYRGDLPIAQQMYTDCLKDISWIDEPDIKASLYHNAGAAAASVGASDVAIERFLLAEQIAREGGLKRVEARALYGLGLEYFERGDLPQARALLGKALELRRGMKDGPGLYASLRVVGTLHRLEGNIADARKYHLESETRAPNAVARMRALIELAQDEDAAGGKSAGIAHLRKALELKLENSSHPAIAEVQLALAQLLLSGPVDKATQREARQLANHALETGTASDDILVEIGARRLLAKADLAQGHRSAARTHLERAIDLVLKYRHFSSSNELQASALSSHQQVFRDYIALLMSSAKKPANPHPASDDELRALRLLETARAAMFTARRSSAAKSSEIETALMLFAAKRASIANLLERAEPPSAEIEKLRFDAAELRAQIDRLRRNSAASDASSLDAFSPSVAPWNPVPPGHTQASYFLAGETAILWERTQGGVRVWTLMSPATSVEEKVAKLLGTDRLQNPASFDLQLQALSRTLLPTGVATGASKIDIIPDGVLTQVPFAGLISPADAARRLIETHIVATVPSVSLTGKARDSRRRWQRVIISDMSESNSLPGANVEAEIVAASKEKSRVLMLDGGPQTAAQLRQAFSEGSDVIHIATHGYVDLEQPLASRLLLPSGRSGGSANYLTAGQIQEWHGGADLVFLSACDTAVGQVRFGDSVAGLQRAFLRAGAREVIATYWSIEDRLAAEFARDFYQYLDSGLSPAESLARTQRAWTLSSDKSSPQIRTRRRVAAWAYALYAH